VTGVSPRDGLRYEARTRLSGVLEKHRAGDPEFEAPAALLAAIRAGRETPWRDPALGEVPVNALSTLDTTGGNSGSPVLNARGELVGLLFDGTWESVAADFLHEPTARSIHVDVRCLLWVLSEVAGARHLLEQLGASAPPAAGGSTAAPAAPRWAAPQRRGTGRLPGNRASAPAPTRRGGRCRLRAAAGPSVGLSGNHGGGAPMIGITGVSGRVGGRLAQACAAKGLAAVGFARRPEAVKAVPARRFDWGTARRGPPRCRA
jgi:hypothetical protein